MRVSGVLKLSRKYKLDCVDLQGKSRESTKKRALENGDEKHKNYRVEIWAGGAFYDDNMSFFVFFGVNGNSEAESELREVRVDTEI